MQSDGRNCFRSSTIKERDAYLDAKLIEMVDLVFVQSGMSRVGATSSRSCKRSPLCASIKLPAVQLFLFCSQLSRRCTDVLCSRTAREICGASQGRSDGSAKLPES